jgi:hypothetical protein
VVIGVATLTFSPAELLAAVILADQIEHTYDIDLDVLAEAVDAGLITVTGDSVALTPSGTELAVRVCARRRVDTATRMAVLACPLCGDPGGYCSGGSCQVWPPQ